MDGKAFRANSTVTKTRQLMDTYPEFDAAGKRVMIMSKVADGTYIDETGDTKIKFIEVLQESSIQIGRKKTVDVEISKML